MQVHFTRLGGGGGVAEGLAGWTRAACVCFAREGGCGLGVCGVAAAYCLADMAEHSVGQVAKREGCHLEGGGRPAAVQVLLVDCRWPCATLSRCVGTAQHGEWQAPAPCPFESGCPLCSVVCCLVTCVLHTWCKHIHSMVGNWGKLEDSDAGDIMGDGGAVHLPVVLALSAGDVPAARPGSCAWC